MNYSLRYKFKHVYIQILAGEDKQYVLLPKNVFISNINEICKSMDEQAIIQQWIQAIQ